MSLGQILFYGGIAGMVVSIAFFVVSTVVFENKKRRFLKDMENE